MEREDFESRRAEKGICGYPVGGRRCDNILNECPFHAPAHLRCQSALEANPTKQCRLVKIPGEDFCRYHRSYPNLSKNLKKYIDEVGLSAVTSKFREVLDGFSKEFYPSATDELPDVVPFFKWYFENLETPETPASEARDAKPLVDGGS